MTPGGRSGWVVSRRTGRRLLWGALGVCLFGAVAVAAVLAFLARPHVDSGVLVLITVPFLVLAVVLALEGLSQGLVRLDADGYAPPLGTRRAWADVLALGTGRVDGHEVPVVAVRTAGDLPVVQDVFTGFTDDDVPRLLAALRERAGDLPGFAGVALSDAAWARVEAEADRAASVVRETAQREPVSRERVSFGYPGLVSAIRLDYGPNDAGEGVALFIREDADLALTAHGRRWLRQNRKRSADAATQVAWLFGPHTSEVVPSDGAGFDRLIVRAGEHRPLPFNAEEPDRF